MSPAGRVMSRIASGCATCTASACSGAAFARRTASWRSARIFGTARRSWRRRAPSSSGCRKPSSQMNLQLPLVVSDITGATGLRILRDIVAGQRDPEHLAQHRDPRCRATAGRDRRRADRPLSRRPPLRVAAESRALRRLSGAARAVRHDHRSPSPHLTAPVAAPAAPLPASRSRRKTPKNNDLRFDVRTPLFHLTAAST